MKKFLNLCCAASAACVIAIAVGAFQPPATKAVLQERAGRETVNFPDPGEVFHSHARSKVVQYFDTFRTGPSELPADLAARTEFGEVPASWITGGIASGMLVVESERSALVEAPQDLVRVLPTRQPSVHYYLAGNHLVALDSGFKVLDSIRIPNVHVDAIEEPVADAGSLWR